MHKSPHYFTSADLKKPHYFAVQRKASYIIPAKQNPHHAEA